MYDISERGQRQYRRVVSMIWGLYILIPLLFLLGCATNEPVEPEFRQDPIHHEDHEYKNKCPDGPLVDGCVMVA